MKESQSTVRGAKLRYIVLAMSPSFNRHAAGLAARDLGKILQKCFLGMHPHSVASQGDEEAARLSRRGREAQFSTT